MPRPTNIVRAATGSIARPAIASAVAQRKRGHEIEEERTGERLPNLLSPSEYIESCRKLHPRYIDLIAQAITVPAERKVIRTASAQDARTDGPLVATLSAFAKVTAISGSLDFARHVTLIAMAAALLSMDSCHAHIAGAVGNAGGRARPRSIRRLRAWGE